MKLTYVLGLVSLTALLSSGGTYLVMDKKDSGAATTDTMKSVEITDLDLSWVGRVHSEMIDEWKSGDRTFDDYLVAEVMEQMTHQKIIADIKVGSVMLTPERVETLMQIVKENEIYFNNSEKYSEILNRWKNDDFTTINNDYVFLRTVRGKETPDSEIGIATKEEELAFITENFGEDKN